MASSFSAHSSNINLLWASLFIEELIRNGIRDFCIAPGSRSTPLTLAVANHPQATAHIHFDERGLGFLALGMAQASKNPVVLITTSGSAVANLYPAVIEARQSGVPLVVISADRPAQLLNCGANQAIDQHAIFGHYPVFFTQIVQPSLDIPSNYLLTTIDHGLNLQRQQTGPIHFNIAFAEPLYPSQQQVDYLDYLSSLKGWLSSQQPFTQYLSPDNGGAIQSPSLQGKRVICVVGKMHSQQQARAVVQFCEAQNLVLLTDIQSSQIGTSSNIDYYDLLLINKTFQSLLHQADVIIQFGEQLVSKRLTTFMQHFNGQVQVVSHSTSRIDPNHQLNMRINADAQQWIAAQQPCASSNNDDWQQSLRKCHDRLAEEVLEPFISRQPFSELSVISALDSLALNNAPLFIANSMPIRLADMLMNKNQSCIYTNRGASGIDGLLASAIGVAKASEKPTTLLIGDTSFLYDLNSLALLKQLTSPFIIIVINNDGGAIFNLLPVPEESKKNFYQLPHDLNFKASCEQFSIDYHNPYQITDFKDIYNHCLQGNHALIEITVDNQQSATQLQQLQELIDHATL